MNYKSTLFQRGQIWWLERDTNEYSPHVMDAKDRYYLVVSCKENNKNAPIANVLVISSREYDKLPMHVSFTMPNGKSSIVECEQIYTKSVTKFQKGSYVGMVSDDVMERVNEALANQLSLTRFIPGYDEILKLIEDLARRKQVETKVVEPLTEDMVLSVCKRILDMFDSLTKSQAIVVKDLPKGHNASEAIERVEKTRDKSSMKGLTATEKFNRRLEKTKELQKS